MINITNLIKYFYKYANSLEEKAILKFKITNNPYEAGYILKNGKFLDFSGRAFADNPDERYYKNERSVDHREVGGYLDMKLGGSEAMIKFMQETGAIRMSLIGDYFAITLIHKPTEEQLRQIIKIGIHSKEMTIDFDDGNGNTKRHALIRIPNKLKINNEILNYFK